MNALTWTDSTGSNDESPSKRAKLVPGSEYPAVRLWTIRDERDGGAVSYQVQLLLSEDMEETILGIVYDGFELSEAEATIEGARSLVNRTA